MSGETKYYSIDSPELLYLREHDRQLDFAIQLVGPLEYKLHSSPFNHFMHTIIEQMLSNKVADVLYDRFVELCGGIVRPDTVCGLSNDELRNIGISRAKASYLLDFAHFIDENPTYFDTINSLSDKELLLSLQEHRGIGGWSSKMYAIFVLDRMDILPYEDGAFLQSIKWLYGVVESNRNHPIIRELCKPWSPYSSLAARYMYRLLDEGFTSKDINTVSNLKATNGA